MATMATPVGRVQQLVKGLSMLLALVETIHRLKVDEQTFFRLAHVWSFGTDPDVSTDVCQWRLHGIVPPYVRKYVVHINEETT